MRGCLQDYLAEKERKVRIREIHFSRVYVLSCMTRAFLSFNFNLVHFSGDTFYIYVLSIEILDYRGSDNLRVRLGERI